MSTLVAATVFSTTFLTNRIHRERGRAIDRALKLDELIADARRDSKDLDAGWFDEQRRVFDESLLDRLAFLALAMNAILAAGVVGLTIAFGVNAGTDWGTAQGWGLIAFALAAVLVFAVGAVDFGRARHSLMQRLGDTTMGQVAVAERAFREAHKGAGGVNVAALEEARTAAAAAIESSHRLYGPACEWLARVELANLADPRPGSNHLLDAGKWLDVAIKAGPRTAAMLATRAFVFEEFAKDQMDLPEQAAARFGEAADAWLEALKLLAQGSEREIRPDDPEVLDRRAKLRITGLDGGAYGWAYLPSRPETLAVALAAASANLLASIGTRMTANLLAQSAKLYPDAAQVAVDGLSAWIDKLTSVIGWPVADILAQQLTAATDAAPVHDLVTRVRSDAGPIGRAKADEAAESKRNREALAKAHRRVGDSLREWERTAKERRQQDEQLLAEMRENAERWERIDRGEATEDDLAWEQREIDEVLARAKEADGEDLAADVNAGLAKLKAEQEKLEESRARTDAKIKKIQQGKQDRARQRRIQTGRATEQDLVEQSLLNAVGTSPSSIDGSSTLMQHEDRPPSDPPTK